MKTIELRRHSKKTGHGNVNLSQEGVALARQVGETRLQGRAFTHLYVSKLQRTTDTMQAFAQGAGDFPALTPSIFLEESDVFGTEDAIKLWEGVCNAAERNGQDMMKVAIEHETARAERIASLGAAAFREWLEKLPDDTHALVVYHSPAIELIAYDLFGVIVPQLQPCEGLRIVSAENLQPTTVNDDSALSAGRF